MLLEPPIDILGGIHHDCRPCLGWLVDFLGVNEKLGDPDIPRVISKSSYASSYASQVGLTIPLPTWKGEWGLNSSEWYVPGRSAFGVL